MPKVITSPLPRWQGSVTLSDPLTLPQVELIEAAFEQQPKFAPEDDSRKYLTEFDKPQIPAILACVEKWELTDFPLPTVDTFPMSPRKATHDLIAWIFGELRRIYIGELEIPNE
jgi:hypothetical protein